MTTAVHETVMEPGLRGRWVAALRDPNLKQTKGRLRSDDGDAFCCLGVLANLIDPDGWMFDSFTEDWCWHGEAQALPLDEWSRLRDENSSCGMNEQQQWSIKNDGGWTFAEIADRIEVML